MDFLFHDRGLSSNNNIIKLNKNNIKSKNFIYKLKTSMFKRYDSYIIRVSNILIFIKKIFNSFMVDFEIFKSILLNINYKSKLE